MEGLKGAKLDIVIISAGYFVKESFDEPDFAGQIAMYKLVAIGPLFIVNHLVKAGLMNKDSKIILVSSESGSITLRHESEGGGNYGHHASKTALNMVGKLLSLDLKDKFIAVGMVHPGECQSAFAKIEAILPLTEVNRFHAHRDDKRRGVRQVLGCRWRYDVSGIMTASQLGRLTANTYYALAVTPDESAESLLNFIEKFDMSKTGEFWAPRGPGCVNRCKFSVYGLIGVRDIGTAEDVLGPKTDLPTPLQLPW